MEYIDTGSRRLDQTLGAWLTQALRPQAKIQAIRWQTGFFSGDILDYFAPQMEALAKRGDPVRVLIGSNDGQTRSADLQRMLALGAAPRAAFQMGLVSYRTGYFHPKTVHVTRSDGSQLAYVGSANLTKSGAGLHIEAGVVLDTDKNDNPLVLQAVARAIDDWFGSGRPGLYEVASLADIAALARSQIVDRPRPTLPPRTTRAGRPQARLTALGSTTRTGGAGSGSDGRRRPTAAITYVWTKALSASDAQRKKKGHQRGSITLVRGPNPIDARSWFRRDFFGDRTWVPSRSNTGRHLEKTTIEFDVSVRGRPLGLKTLSVSFDKGRESSQSNYTTLLHLGDLSDLFVRQDLAGERLMLARTARGDFFLSIGQSAS